MTICTITSLKTDSKDIEVVNSLYLFGSTTNNIKKPASKKYSIDYHLSSNKSLRMDIQMLGYIYTFFFFCYLFELISH